MKSTSGTIAAAMKRAADCLTDSELLLKQDRLFASINRSYYAIFYALTALAVKYGFKTSKHQQLIGWFNKEFVKTGKIQEKFGQTVYLCFEQRLEGDYEVHSHFSKNEAEDLYRSAVEFVDEIKKLI